MIKIRKDSDLPLVNIQLTYSDGTPINLNDVSTINMYLYDTEDTLKYTISCGIISPDAGVISANLSEVDTGFYSKTIVITFSDGNIMIVPSEAPEYIMVW